MAEAKINHHLSVAICNAVLACEALAKDNLLSERTLTGALLGALKASFALSKDPNLHLGWAVYNEGREDNDYSEAATGVDFALIVALNSGELRFAVFQAKRTNNEDYTHIRANQTRGKKPNQTSQLATLYNASVALMNQVQNRNDVKLRDLRWVHYLAYCNPILAVPLTSMKDQLADEMSKPGSSTSFDATDLGCNLLDMLPTAAMPKSLSWLTIGTVRQHTKLPAFFSEMPLVFIAGQPLGMKPRKFLRSLLTVQKPRVALRAGRRRAP